jgi:7-cyano-7-deazaguanine synthase in queuosine biosynthesis
VSTKATVRCRVQGFRRAFKVKPIVFSTGTDLRMLLDGKVGPRGITRTAADLVDFAAAVYQIERQLRGRQRTNRPEKFTLTMQLRDPDAWNSQAVEAAQNALQLLGNARWQLNLKQGLKDDVQAYQATDLEEVRRVVLFSGGMDSTCGLASIAGSNVEETRLVSFYTHQKSLQRSLAFALGFNTPPIQWRMVWQPPAGRNHSFFYRSFFFLCLAAAVAESWGAREILQFENGVLALSIPPTESWMMTKHAHPVLHELMSELFSALFGGEWRVRNPFQLCTKRDCFREAARSIGEPKVREVLQQTETCWFHWSNRVRGGKKRPGKPCGVCIPCVVRRTGLQDDDYQWDLREEYVRNDRYLGSVFFSYYLFLKQVHETRNQLEKFYELLPAAGRNLLSPVGVLTMQELQALLLRFRDEFWETYQL